MGWRTDWLYGLVFREIERIWARARKEGADGRFGPAPDFLVVRQYAGANWIEPECAPPVLREWVYSGGELEPRPPTDSDKPAPLVRRGMFWDVGAVRFHIAPDRKRVVLTFQIGPLYGRGHAFRVGGQGKTSVLERDPDSRAWIS